jgi:hypothetical protein
MRPATRGLWQHATSCSGSGSGGGALRRRRALPATAAALATMAAASVLALALPAGPSAGGGSQATLTAFTVTEQHRTVDVTIRQLENRMVSDRSRGMQRKLSDDGVPAIVGFHASRASPSIPERRLASQGATAPRWRDRSSRVTVMSAKARPGGTVAFEIHSARIPRELESSSVYARGPSITSIPWP